MQTLKFKLFLILVSLCSLVYLIINSVKLKKLQNYKKSSLKEPNSKEEIILSLISNCDCRRDQVVVISRNNKTVSVYLKQLHLNESSLILSEDKTTFENRKYTCGLYNVLRRGLNQKVIGFSLYGENLFYYEKLRNITKQLKQFYPDWFMRVYYDKSIDKKTICEIECQMNDDTLTLINNADFCYVNEMYFNLNDYLNKKEQSIFNAGYIHSMKWRWFPIGDHFVDVFSSRDTDSFIFQREIDSANEWLSAADKVGHIMRGIDYLRLIFKTINFIFLLYFINRTVYFKITRITEHRFWEACGVSRIT